MSLWDDGCKKNDIRAGDLLVGALDDKDRSTAKKICPSYCGLVPVFRGFSFPIEAPSSSSGEDEGKGNQIEEGEVKGYTVEEEEIKEVEATSTTFEGKSAAVGRKRPSDEAFRSIPVSVAITRMHRPLSSGTTSITGRRPQHGVSSQLAACKLDYAKKTMQDAFESEQAKRVCAVQVEQSRVDAESNAERYRAEAEQARMEAEKARAATEQHKSEIERERITRALQVEGVMSRHEMAEKGVAPEDIELILPL